jgi:hypothetical protein
MAYPETHLDNGQVPAVAPTVRLSDSPAGPECRLAGISIQPFSTAQRRPKHIEVGPESREFTFWLEGMTNEGLRMVIDKVNQELAERERIVAANTRLFGERVIP